MSWSQHGERDGAVWAWGEQPAQPALRQAGIRPCSSSALTHRATAASQGMGVWAVTLPRRLGRLCSVIKQHASAPANTPRAHLKVPGFSHSSFCNFEQG